MNLSAHGELQNQYYLMTVYIVSLRLAQSIIGQEVVQLLQNIRVHNIGMHTNLLTDKALLYDDELPS